MSLGWCWIMVASPAVRLRSQSWRWIVWQVAKPRLRFEIQIERREWSDGIPFVRSEVATESVGPSILAREESWSARRYSAKLPVVLTCGRLPSLLHYQGDWNWRRWSMSLKTLMVAAVVLVRRLVRRFFKARVGIPSIPETIFRCNLLNTSLSSSDEARRISSSSRSKECPTLW